MNRTPLGVRLACSRMSSHCPITWSRQYHGTTEGTMKFQYLEPPAVPISSRFDRMPEQIHPNTLPHNHLTNTTALVVREKLLAASRRRSQHPADRQTGGLRASLFAREDWERGRDRQGLHEPAVLRCAKDMESRAASPSAASALETGPLPFVSCERVL